MTISYERIVRPSLESVVETALNKEVNRLKNLVQVGTKSWTENRSDDGSLHVRGDASFTFNCENGKPIRCEFFFQQAKSTKAWKVPEVNLDVIFPSTSSTCDSDDEDSSEWPCMYYRDTREMPGVIDSSTLRELVRRLDSSLCPSQMLRFLLSTAIASEKIKVDNFLRTYFANSDDVDYDSDSDNELDGLSSLDSSSSAVDSNSCGRSSVATLRSSPTTEYASSASDEESSSPLDDHREKRRKC